MNVLCCPYSVLIVQLSCEMTQFYRVKEKKKKKKKEEEKTDTVRNAMRQYDKPEPSLSYLHSVKTPSRNRRASGKYPTCGSYSSTPDPGERDLILMTRHQQRWTLA